MLAEKVDEKSIVKAAWISDEQKFKQAYVESLALNVETGEKSYNQFQDIMKKLVVIRKREKDLGESIRKNKRLFI